MLVAIDGGYFGVGKKLSAPELIQLAKDTGADGLNWPFHENYGANDPGEPAAALKEAGLAAVSLGPGKHISATPGSETEFRDMFAGCAEAADAFGTRIIDCWPRRPEGVTKAHAQEVLTDNLRAVMPVAEKAACFISLEFEPDTTIERFAEAKAFVEPFGPAVRLTADTYHIIRIGDDLAEAGALLGDRIGVVHFSGSHRGEPGTAGDRCDYEGFLRAALAAGYQGDVVLQYKPPEDTKESLTRAVALAREVVNAAQA